MTKLTVGELKRLIAYMPDSAFVVIGGEIVNGVALVTGREAAVGGYYNPIFNEAAKGKEKALMFTKCSELSNGEVITDSKI